MIAKKNSLIDGGAWLPCVRILIENGKEIDYDNSGDNFTPGKWLTGDDSGARARIVSVSTLSANTGTIQLYNITGEFWDNEQIRDNEAPNATAIVNGTLSSVADREFWFTQGLTTITFDGRQYRPRAMEIDIVSEDARGKTKEATIKLADMATETGATSFCHLIDSHQGILGEECEIIYVHSCFLSDTAVAVREQYIINECAVGQEWAIISLTAPDDMPTKYPRRTYDNKHCEWQFGSTITCQISSVTTWETCDHTLANCVERDNVNNFGAFPSIPIGEFE
jgi:phage-related protein